MKIKIIYGSVAYIKIFSNNGVFVTDKDIANLLGFKSVDMYLEKFTKEVFKGCRFLKSVDVNHGFSTFKPIERIEVYLERFKMVFANEIILAKLGGE